MSIYRFRNRDTADKIMRILKSMNLNLTLMHVCGTHQDTLVRYGLDSLLRDCGIIVRQGPGCPVCVTTLKEYEQAITLAKEGVTLVTFGDAAQVRGKKSSLLNLRAEGCDVKIVYSILDAMEIAKKTTKKVVFLAVGFETTAPSTAIMILKGLPKNFSILNSHRYIPPALDKLICMGETRIQGIIEPGHVSAIIGIKPYEEISKKHNIPQVISGFEPLDMLISIYLLALQIRDGEARVENEYSRVVKYEGNIKALKSLDAVFDPINIDWRGFPVVKRSGMKLKKKYEEFDAEKIYEDTLRNIDAELDVIEGCRCGEILRGIIDPIHCPLFVKKCSPTNPIGPCMVSVEGTCNIMFKYKKELI